MTDTIEILNDKLIHLRSSLEKIDGELSKINEARKEKNIAKTDILKKISMHKKILKEKYNDVGGVFVTDHAIIRYVERHLGVDTDAIREKIKCNIPNNCTDGDYDCIPSYLKAVVSDNVVKTIIPRG